MPESKISREEGGIPNGTPPQDAGGASPAISTFLCLWFLLVAVAFWGPYLQLGGFAPVGLALYGVAVLIVAATASLRFLRRREEAKRHVN